jgi:predicted  nucleic acid-binding Zn-ribbon protein
VRRGYDRLLELQELDLSIDRLEHRRHELEAGTDIQAARAQADAAGERVGELRLALDSVRREETRLESEISSLDLRIRAEQGRLYDGSVANPRELQSIEAEVNNLRARKTRLEDEELDQMERREELESRLPTLEAELKEARDRLAEVETSSERELGEIGTSLEQRRAERHRLAGELDEDLLDLYESLRAQKRGVGAAALSDGVCQGCHEKLSPLALDRIRRSDDIPRCENCRRILVLD